VLWDNPSRTVIEPGFNEETRWTSEVGDRVSFFVIAGDSTDEIYGGYRQLTGTTPCFPKPLTGTSSASSATSSQDEVMAVAKATASGSFPST